MGAEMTVSDAVVERRSTRAFVERRVDRDEIEKLLLLAANAPSNGNTQPWRVHVLTGTKKADLTKAVFARAAESTMGNEHDVPIYSKSMGKPWRTRRFECGDRMYEALRISCEDKHARMMQGAKNLSFFDAPVGRIVTLDRSLGELHILDCGTFVQILMLLAQERGLATCPQAAWSMWLGTIRMALDLPETEIMLMGIALSDPDTSEVAANNLVPRIGHDEFLTFHGFES